MNDRLTPPGPASEPSWEQRIQRLEDIEAIKNLHHRYIRRLADRHWGDLSDMFTDDAVTDIRWHGRTVGKQELIDQVLTPLHGIVRSADGYILSSPVIELEAGSNEAYGEWTWHRHVCDFRTTGGYMRVWGPWLEGRYKCHYRKENGTWKLSNVWFRVVLPDPDPTPEEMADRQGAAPPHRSGVGIFPR
jgi:SnoaL-like domain